MSPSESPTDAFIQVGVGHINTVKFANIILLAFHIIIILSISVHTAIRTRVNLRPGLQPQRNKLVFIFRDKNWKPEKELACLWDRTRAVVGLIDT